jgi:hypothetical protein
MDSDLLDGLLDLEERFYEEGYELGAKDGARAGYNEGVVFAVEKSFEKFQEMGRLYGKGIIWAKRLPGGKHGLLVSSHHIATAEAAVTGDKALCDVKTCAEEDQPAGPFSGQKLPSFPENPRLEKHLATFLSLVDPTTLSMDNTEDAVADFDDRLKKASAKAKVIERIIGEQSEPVGHDGARKAEAAGSGNIEDIGPLPPRFSQTP